METVRIHDADVDITKITVIDSISAERPWKHSPRIRENNSGGFEYHLMYLREGSYYHTAGENSLFIPTHSLGLAIENHRVFRNISADLPLRYICLWFVTKEPIPLPFGEFSQVCLAPEQSRGCEEKMLAALQLYRDRPFGWRLRLRGIVEELLLRVFTVYWEEKNEEDMPELIKTATDLIRSRIFSVPLSVDDVAQECHISTTHLIRLFRRYLKTTPKKYMDNLRVERACELLKYTAKSMEAIAAESGFTEARQMRRIFCEIKGITPREYRGQS
ncbi:MAG: helix-turn-helix transcriptional regulator [Ruminococcaceae bacterium]|nr:helix-turn-helix transcriptional regulator [Oscillospiraceae bacterium]